MDSRFLFSLLGLLGACPVGTIGTTQAWAAVGQLELVTTERTAAIRDAQHRSTLRITVWYPAAADAHENPLGIGDPDKPSFDVGTVAPGAAFAQNERYPTILLSHGFGGSARMMGWFGIAMARRGYVVAAVDHPGNNGRDEMTMAGAILWWDRVEDLRSALDAIGKDRTIGPRLDRDRLGVAGFSAGGFAALVAAGARPDPSRFLRFCRNNPEDGDCQPGEEFAATMEERAQALALLEFSADVARAGEDHAIAELRAAFAIAPAWVQSFEPASLSSMRVPVHIVQGDSDAVEPPKTSGLAAAAAIPQAQLDLLSGVSHYDFLSTCTEAGRIAIPACASAHHQEEAHRRAISAAEVFFGRFLVGTR